MRVNTVMSSAVSPVCSTRTNKHFDTMRSIQRSFIHSTTMSLLYRVPAVFAPQDSEPARRGARRLSHVEMSGTKTLTRNKNKKKNKNATQYIHRLIYWLALVRQRKDVSPAKLYLLNRQWISILPGTNRPSAETNRSRLGVSPVLILTPNMATSRSTYGPEPKLHCQSLLLF